MGPLDHLVVPIKILAGKTEPFQLLEQDLGIHDPHHHFFPESHRHRGNPDFNLHFPLVGLDAAVLGPALFRHVHAGQRLDAADNGGMHLFGQLVDGMQHTVDAHAHPEVFPLGFDMDIAGPLLKGI